MKNHYKIKITRHTKCFKFYYNMILLWNCVISSNKSNVIKGSSSSRKKVFNKTAARCTSLPKSTGSPRLIRLCKSLKWLMFADLLNNPSVSKAA